MAVLYILLVVIAFMGGLIAGAKLMLNHCRKERGQIKTRRRLNKIDKILIIIGITTIAFVCTILYLFSKYQLIPDSLVVGYFAAVFGEVSICGWIKSSAEKNKKNLEDLENESNII